MMVIMVKLFKDISINIKIFNFFLVEFIIIFNLVLRVLQCYLLINGGLEFL